MISQFSLIFFKVNLNSILIVDFFAKLIFVFTPSLFFMYFLKYSSANSNLKEFHKLNIKDYFFVITSIIFLTFSVNLFDEIINLILPQKSIDLLYKFSNNSQMSEIISFNNSNFVYVIFFVCLTPAIFEELLFRGYLQYSIATKFSKFQSIIITSLIFALLHMDIISFFSIFLLSCVIGFYKEKTNSLFYPILIHFMNNLFNVLIFNLN